MVHSTSILYLIQSSSNLIRSSKPAQPLPFITCLAILNLILSRFGSSSFIRSFKVNSDIPEQLYYKFDIVELKHSLHWVLDDADINRVDSLCLTHAPTKQEHQDDYYYQGAVSLYYEFKSAPGEILKTKR